MADEGSLKSCAYYLVRYVPHAEREEFLNIGLLLHSPEEQFLDCLFTRDLRRVKRFHPQADLEFLREPCRAISNSKSSSTKTTCQASSRRCSSPFPTLIQLAPARPVLAAEPQAQLLQLFERLVGKRQADSPAAGTRMRIRQRLVEALRRA